jgi:ribonuclease H2 subunit A
MSTSSWIMGIDEAGRGPVLGPMVYGACVYPLSMHDTVKQTGVADSKQLKHEDRERIFSELEELERQKSVIRLYTVLDPELLSAEMLRREKVSLNVISHDTAIELVRQVLKNNPGIRLEHVYIDTVGDPGKYQDKMSKIFPDIKFTVASKADSKYPVVSAASIVAKVIRDRNLEGWKFPEGDHISREFGCGYPSDPITKQWLRDNFDPVFGFPSLVRFSWSTCTKLIEQNGFEVEWNDERDAIAPDQSSLSQFFSDAKKSGEHVRGKFFQDKKLSLVSKW